MERFANSLEHELAELERIDLLIQARVCLSRQVSKTDRDFQGLYISEQELDVLLARPVGLPRWASEATPLSLATVQASIRRMSAEITQRKVASAKAGVELRLEKLALRFGLTEVDVDALLICMAPEFDLRYERIYAYLQDDVTKKRPSVDLVLNLLSDSFQFKLDARQRFTPHSPLMKHHLLQLLDDQSQSQAPLLAKGLKVEERIVRYLLDSDEIDDRLLAGAQRVSPIARLEDLRLPGDIKQRLKKLLQRLDRGLVIHLVGPYGAGKRTTAEALCRELGMAMLVVDFDGICATESPSIETTVRLVRREAILQEAVLYWKGFDLLLTDDKQRWRNAWIEEFVTFRNLMLVAGETEWEPSDACHELTWVRVELPNLTGQERFDTWKASLVGAAETDLSVLASKFRLNGGQIRDAAATARNLACWRDPEDCRVSRADLHQACRLQSSLKLSSLARKINPHYRWSDLVLPADRVEQLQEICNYVRYRPVVYEQWGFDEKLSLGKGLQVLFSGPSGTGKTMAAEIFAGELGLDIYKIDLSLVVSKYIGETEKNLSRIFSEAATSNAILFFDEADALFGKRTEVRDAHDRYANIETNYLLQKMEEYEGIVILSTNLRKNMDDAFVRRLHFTVEFPFPSESERLRIWEAIWPESTPRNKEMKPEFLARQFELTGGHIRNIALASAFLAASDGRPVGMQHVLGATRREYQKIGKLMSEEQFNTTLEGGVRS